MSPTDSQRQALPPHEPRRGNETILVVEDADAIRKLVTSILTNRGYRVLTAADGAQALALAHQHQGTIHLLLTDMVMPNMSGQDLATQLLTLRPQTKVLFTSGYTDKGDETAKHLPNTTFLQKPFTPADLTNTLRELLDT